MSAAPVRVFFPCTGLGREARGFEAFTRECAAALRGRSDVEVTVFAGGGSLEKGERFAANLPRSSGAAKALGRLLGRDAYYVEQASFFAGFLPALLTGSPDVVYFGDINLGNACWHWRQLTGARYRLLYYNGGATTRPFTRCDLVQQVSPEHLDAALARGERRERQVLLPHGVTVAQEWRPPSADSRRRARASVGVPQDGTLLLGVGALDATVKRWDVAIRAVAALPAPRPHFLILGAETPETDSIRILARNTLGESGCTVRTVPRATMAGAYTAADAFILASLREGFGLAYVESLSAGLPAVVHATPTTEFIFGATVTRGDLATSESTAQLLQRMLAGPRDDGAARARHERAYDRFSWDRLAPRYAELLVAAARGTRPAFDEARS